MDNWFYVWLISIILVGMFPFIVITWLYFKGKSVGGYQPIVDYDDSIPPKPPKGGTGQRYTHLHEGMVKKGGVNNMPKTPRPLIEPPGQRPRPIIIKATIALSDVLNENNDMITTHALANSVKDKLPYIPVTNNFSKDDVIGEVKSLRFIGNELEGEMALIKRVNLNNKVIRAEGSVSEIEEKYIDGKKVRILNDFKVMSVGLINIENDAYRKINNGICLLKINEMP